WRPAMVVLQRRSRPQIPQARRIPRHQVLKRPITLPLFSHNRASIRRYGSSEGEMKTRPLFARAIAISTALVMSVHSGLASAANDQKAVAALDTQYQEAVKANDAATMDRILLDDFVLVIGNGSVQTKADLLKEAKSGRVVYEHQEELART